MWIDLTMDKNNLDAITNANVEAQKHTDSKNINRINKHRCNFIFFYQSDLSGRKRL